ncbi:MAG: AAA family ATPase [Gammaproteobacteria bacterium]
MSGAEPVVDSRDIEPVDASIQAILDGLGRIILGKPDTLRLALTCLLARGHLLIEDVPGVGKTTLAQALASVLGLTYQRVQFTSDLLPADVVGVSMFDRNSNEFVFHPGPLFNQVVVADEINRATPKTQSALLEAMQEQQVTVDGVTHDLPDPFFVIATQNPTEQVGTFPLPESQLDRFLMRLSVGFPSPQTERELLLGEDRAAMIREMQPVLTSARLQQLQQEAAKVHVSDALLDYLQAVVAMTRSDPRLNHPLSPRAALGLLRCARAHALIRGADAVIPDDVQAVAVAVIDHRVHWRDAGARLEGRESVGNYVIQSVPVSE